MDCNFKLKRRKVSSEEKDPALSDGLAYMVEQKPYDEYLERNKNVVQQVRQYLWVL